MLDAYVCLTRNDLSLQLLQNQDLRFDLWHIYPVVCCLLTHPSGHHPDFTEVAAEHVAVVAHQSNQYIEDRR